MPEDNLHFKAPLVALVDVTDQCTHNCFFCYSHVRHQQGYNFDEESTYIEKANVIKQLSKLKIKVVNFSGGEPLLYPPILDLVRISKSHGILTAINSNLWLLDRKLAGKLKKLEIDSITTSLYAAKETKHDKITGVQGSFQKTKGGIRLLQESGIPVTVNITLTKKNFRELKQLGEMLINMGVKAVSISRYIADQRGHVDMGLGADEIKDVALKLSMLQQKGTVFFFKTGVPFCATSQTLRGSYCLAGILQCCITANLKVKWCPLTEETVGDLKKDDLESIWDSRKRERWANAIPEECTHCAVLSQCGGGCKRLASVQFGSYKAADPLYKQPLSENELTSICQAKGIPDLMAKFNMAEFTGYILSKGIISGGKLNR